MSGLHDKLDWNLLKTFIAIVQEGSISRAAERLHLTQPAVSLALKRLEERLDECLIIRNGSSFELSKTGENVYREAIKVYGNIARLTSSIGQEANDLSGTIRLAVVTGVNSDEFDQVLANFHQKNPKVTFEIITGDSSEVQQALLNYHVSLGICLKYKSISELEDTLLLQQRYDLYCGRSHRFFGRKNISIEDLRDEGFLSFTSEQLDGVLAPLAIFRAQEHFEGQIVGTSPSLSEIRRMIAAGMGIGALPRNAVLQDVEAATLWQLPPYDGIADINLYLMWNKKPKISEAEQVFMTEFLSELSPA